MLLLLSQKVEVQIIYGMVCLLNLLFSALTIVKPLPKETYLTPGEALDMSITISASIKSEDHIKISMGHSLKGKYEDVTKYLTHTFSEESKDKIEGEEDSKTWIVDMALSYPFGEDLGNLILSIGDNHSGGITTTRLFIGEDTTLVKPFFDPEPESIEADLGDDILIVTEAKGSSPIEVSVLQISSNSLFLFINKFTSINNR